MIRAIGGVKSLINLAIGEHAGDAIAGFGIERGEISRENGVAVGLDGDGIDGIVGPRMQIVGGASVGIVVLVMGAVHGTGGLDVAMIILRIILQVVKEDG